MAYQYHIIINDVLADLTGLKSSTINFYVQVVLKKAAASCYTAMAAAVGLTAYQQPDSSTCFAPDHTSTGTCASVNNGVCCVP